MKPLLFLHRCPSCGRRFGVKLLGRKLVDEQSDTETETVSIPILSGTRGVGVSGAINMDERTTYATDRFELSFQCSKCGHMWTEKSTKVKRSG